MKLGLAEWVKTSVTCGRSTFELRSPAGDPIFHGAHYDGLHEELRQLAEEDARTQSGKLLVYTVWAKSDDGRSSSRYTLELAGGRDAGEGVPDASSLSNANASFGHLVRLVIESNRALREMARDVAQARSSEVHEQRAIVSKYARLVARHGEEAITMKLLEIEEGKTKAKGEALGAMAKGALPIALGLAARVGLLPAGPVAGAPAAANAVDAFLSSLDAAQGEKLFALLGPARAAKVLRARGPDAARELVLIVLHECTEQEQASLLALLRPEQVQTLNALFVSVSEQVDEENAKKAAANGAGHATGGSA